MAPATSIAILASMITAAEPVPVERLTAPPEPTAALASLEAEQSSLFARVAPSVVLIVRDGASGSGFVVAPGGLVLTNAHVVGEADEVAVQLLDGRYGRAPVVARATGTVDLALVRIPFLDVAPLPAGDLEAVRAGTFAATVGHGGGAAWTFSTGLVANPRPLGEGAPLLLAQMALRPGSSGGPLVDRQGRVVAVVTAGTRDASGVTFAIRIDAAAAAFPQLASAIVTHVAGAARAGVARGAPEGGVGVAVADGSESVTGVAQLAAGARGRPTPLVTVWEAPRRNGRGGVRAAVRQAEAGRAHPATEPARRLAATDAAAGAGGPTLRLVLTAALAGGAATAVAVAALAAAR
jgi:S1-C subfamily serine protease